MYAIHKMSFLSYSEVSSILNIEGGRLARILKNTSFFTYYLKTLPKSIERSEILKFIKPTSYVESYYTLNKSFKEIIEIPENLKLIENLTPDSIKQHVQNKIKEYEDLKPQVKRKLAFERGAIAMCAICDNPIFIGDSNYTRTNNRTVHYDCMKEEEVKQNGHNGLQ